MKAISDLIDCHLSNGSLTRMQERNIEINDKDLSNQRMFCYKEITMFNQRDKRLKLNQLISIKPLKSLIK